MQLSKISFQKTIVPLILCITFAAAATAEEAARAAADIDGDGQPEAVHLVRTPEGVRLAISGRTIAESLARGVHIGQGEAELRIIELGSNRRAALYRAPLESDGLAYEAILLLARHGAPTLVWSGVTGLRGDRGTRWGDRVIVEDLTGDGSVNILVASVAEEVPLCGIEQPELFPRALNPTNGRLQPVLLNRLRNLAVKATPLTASRENPGTLSPEPALSVASFAIASTLVGDRGAVEGLSAPRALTDGNPSTAWVEGRPGPGTGEFVSARLLPGPYRIHALALTLAPSTGEGQESRNLGRPRTMSLLLGGTDGLRRYQITINEDPIDYRGEPVWVHLPQPVRARCLSLVIGEVFGGRRAPASTAIAEVAVFTDLDFEGGAEHLMASLSEGAADIEVLLRALGTRGIPLLEERWSDLSPEARRRAVRVLVTLEDPASAELLVDAALGEDSRAAEEAQRGLMALGESALTALETNLRAEDEGRRIRVISLLGRIGTDAAIEHLVNRTVTDPTPEAADFNALRRALSRALNNSETALDVRAGVLERAGQISGRPRQVLLRALSPARDEERERFAELIVESWQEATSYEDRYRLLTAAAGGGAPAALTDLVTTVLQSDEDRYLRARAAEVLGHMGEGQATTAESLSAGVDDEWPGVRLATADALGLIDAAANRPALDRLLSDSWPIIRISAARSLARSHEEDALRPLVSALADPSPVVQINAVRLLGELALPAALGPLQTLVQDTEANDDTRKTAARAIGALCTSTAQSVLVELVTTAREERRDRSRVEVAAAAASALGRYHDETVAQLLIQAARSAAPPLRIAAIEALGQGGHSGAREALQALAEDPLPPLSAAAAAALRQLEVHERIERDSCPRD